MSCLTKVDSLLDRDVFEDEFLGNGYDSTWCGMDRTYALSFIISYVRKYGYTRMFNGQGTAHDVWVCINGGLHDEEMTARYNSIKLASNEELKAIDDYAREHMNDDFGYMRNASLSWLKSGVEYRDFGLVSSFVVSYDKAMQKEELKKSKLSDKNNEWVGNVGDRITIEVASIRLLYSSSYEVAWHTYANSYTYEIIDNEGHTFILKSSMAGELVTVMSNSGSGNQGIAATMPVLVYAKERRKTKEDLVRALILSHLTVIYIKQSFGRLSPLCGCVVAATGSACGLTYLMDGTYEQIAYAVKNMIANITGMICDGAKPSCSLKVATGASTAILSSMLAIEDKTVSSVEGIITDDVDQCILNMNAIGTKGMSRTDELVLDMMTHK